MKDEETVINRLPPFDWYRAAKREERAKLIEGVYVMAGLILLFVTFLAHVIAPNTNRLALDASTTPTTALPHHKQPR